MVAIRREQATGNHGPDPVLDLPQGAHLKVKTQKVFPPKFGEEDGALWTSTVSLALEVIDDFDEGDDDGKVFTDRFELKLTGDLLKTIMNNHGWEEEKQFRNSNKADFTEKEIAAILDPTNWIVRDNTKLDGLLAALHGKRWKNGEIAFDPEELPGAEFRAKVEPRTGKRQGSFCGWESFSSATRPKKKSKRATADKQTNEEAQEGLSKDDEAAMYGALGKS